MNITTTFQYNPEMQTLPITHVIPEIKEKLSRHNRVVLQAPPGAGKTTLLPLVLLEEPWLEDKKILILEPRRLAVRSAASRMAGLLGEKIGERIGYQIKMDSVQSAQTRILIVTEAILTRKLQNDPALEEFALLIFDEFHERSLDADLALALSLESQSILREELKILVMSATLDTEALSKMLDGAPVIESEGRSFPVEYHYLPPDTPQPSKRELPAHIHRLLQKLIREEEGNILVFLPGTREIRAIEALLREHESEELYISPLYGNLSKEAQERAIQAPPPGTRKIVLSTNIAQTSLTIEGIRIVIDSGLQNLALFNPSSGMSRLESAFVSQDAALQRAGRAGRLSPGKAYRLWHRSKILLPHDIPEILQADLSPLLLELALWGNDDITSLSWLDLPPQAALSHAAALLQDLGAIDADGTLTPHGRAMASYPMHPRLAHMMLAGKTLGLAYEASLLAVLIGEKDIYRDTSGSVDLRERLSVLHEVRRGRAVEIRSIDLKQCRYLLKSAARIEPKRKERIDLERIGVLLAFAYPDRIAKRRGGKSTTYLLANGKGALLHRQEEFSGAEFLVIADLDAKGRNAIIRRAATITSAQIERYHREQIRRHDDLSWNAQEQRIEARRITKLGALTLASEQLHSVPGEQVTALLVKELQRLGLEALNWSAEALSLKRRVYFLTTQGVRLPDFSDDYLLGHMDRWLVPYLNDISTLKACQNLDLYPILLGQLSYEERKQVDRLAPARLQVASGSQIPIDYSDPRQPVLAVRLQEMFGTRKTPTLLDGKVTLMLHLLSPASRPMQMTMDLESFWTHTYEEVKKELRGRYKKHYWPDDPLTATATSRTKKRM